MKVLSLSLFIILFSSSCTRNSHDFSELNIFLNHLSKHDKAIGSALILEKEEVIFSKNYGQKDKDKNKEKEIIYHIGSISKTYTAAIILKLIEEGKFQFNTKLSSFYPNIPNADEIEIKHLLQHRSGLKNFTATKDYQSYRSKPLSEEEFIKMISLYPTQFKPGQKYKYSNTGYVLLSYIAQVTSKLSFQQLLDKYIVEPLSLKSTYVYDIENPRPNEVMGMIKEHQWKVAKKTHQSVPLGAGAIASTAKEVALFFNALVKGKIIHPKSFQIMKIMKDGYGFGLLEVPFNKYKGIGHTGGVDGYRSIAFYFPQKDIVVVNLVNALDMVMNDISVAILKDYFKMPITLPIFPKHIKVEQSILNNYIGTYESKDLPIDISFTQENGFLYGQATGQERFPLNAIADNEFEYSQVGVLIKFFPKNKTIKFSQAGNEYLMKLKK
tara:strand:- start:87288 stop:88604 length:1317 start_codon:yes stop_codon:yes gene_type:complete